jgi:predicted tellurium resistance membrane protein TerC
MDKYPIIIYIGAAILGKVGGEMMITDPFVTGWLNPSKWTVYFTEAFFAFAVIAVGKLLVKRMMRAATEASPGVQE